MSAPAAARVPIGILAVQGAVRAHARVLTGLGADVREVRRETDLAGLAGIVLPGGESTTMSRLLEHNDLFEPLHSALAGGLAALGTCAGMILLSAEVLDGRPDQRCFAAIDLSVRRNAFGRQLDSFEADLAVAELPDDGGRPVHAVFIRAPFIERVGDGVDVLARVDGHPVCARQGSVLVTAFHPELSGDPRIHQAFLRVCS